MPERASIYEGSYLGLETTYGTTVPTIVQLSGLTIDNTQEFKFNPVTSMGHKFPTTFSRWKEHTTATISGMPSYYDLLYMMESLIGNATVTPVTAFVGGGTIFPPTGGGTGTPPTGGGTGTPPTTPKTFDWVWKPDPSCHDVFSSYTVEKGCGMAASRFNGAVVTAGSLKFSSEGVNFDGTMVGRFLSDGQTLSSPIQHLPVFPLNPDSVSVYYGTTPASFTPFQATYPEFTKLTRCMEVSWDVAEHRMPSFYLDAAETSFTAITEKAFDSSFKISTQLDSNATTIINDARNNTRKWIKIRVKGVPIFDDVTKFHELEITAPVHTITTQRGDKDSVYSADFDLKSVLYAGGFNSGVQVALRVGVGNLTDVARLAAIAA